MSEKLVREFFGKREKLKLLDKKRRSIAKEMEELDRLISKEQKSLCEGEIGTRILRYLRVINTAKKGFCSDIKAKDIFFLSIDDENLMCSFYSIGDDAKIPLVVLNMTDEGFELWLEKTREEILLTKLKELEHETKLAAVQKYNTLFNQKERIESTLAEIEAQYGSEVKSFLEKIEDHGTKD